MRASYDTLFSLAKGVLAQDPFSGHLFVFINSRRNSVKCLFYDGTGLVILAKTRPRTGCSREATRRAGTCGASLLRSIVFWNVTIPAREMWLVTY